VLLYGCNMEGCGTQRHHQPPAQYNNHVLRIAKCSLLYHDIGIRRFVHQAACSSDPASSSRPVGQHTHSGRVPPVIVICAGLQQKPLPEACCCQQLVHNVGMTSPGSVVERAAGTHHIRLDCHADTNRCMHATCKLC
jgi:hypothetical protein